MTWFDYGVLLIIAASVIMSMIHGLVRELMALASWVIAFLGAQEFASDAALLLSTVVSDPSLRVLAGFLAVFMSILVALTLLTLMVSGLVRVVGLGPVDRLFGAVFGLVRGLVIVLLAVLLAGMTPLPRQQAWQHAMLSAPLEDLASMIKMWLPNDISKRIIYD